MEQQHGPQVSLFWNSDMAAVTSCEIFCTGILRTRGGVVAEWLTSGTPDLEVRGSSLARRVVSLNKELYCTLSLFTQVYK